MSRAIAEGVSFTAWCNRGNDSSGLTPCLICTVAAQLRCGPGGDQRHRPESSNIASGSGDDEIFVAAEGDYHVRARLQSRIEQWPGRHSVGAAIRLQSVAKTTGDEPGAGRRECHVPLADSGLLENRSIRLIRSPQRHALVAQYNAQRMVMDYVMQYYGPANLQYQTLSAAEGEPAKPKKTRMARFIRTTSSSSRRPTYEPTRCLGTVVSLSTIRLLGARSPFLSDG